MLETFDYLRMEVNYRIDRMIPIHQINIIMFSEDITVIGENNKLSRMTTDNKKYFKSKLDKIRAAGKNDDMLEPFSLAFGEAFKTKPEMIVFLTDGNFDPRLVDVVSSLNKDKRTVINTIAYVNISKDAEDNLKRISGDNKGIYKFVSKKDLE
jgi:hypothetical protein